MILNVKDFELWASMRKIHHTKLRYILDRYYDNSLNEDDKLIFKEFEKSDKNKLKEIIKYYSDEDYLDILNVILRKKKVHRQTKSRILNDINQFARSNYLDSFLNEKDKYQPYQMIYFGCDKHVINFTYNLNALDFHIFLTQKDEVIEINGTPFGALHSGFGWDGWIKSLKNFDVTIKLGTKGDAKKIKEYVLSKENAWLLDNEERNLTTEIVSTIENKNLQIYCQVQFMSIAIFENRFDIIWDVFDYKQVSKLYWSQIDYCYDFTVNNVDRFLDSIYINDSRFKDYKKKKNEKWTHDYTYKSKDFYIKVYDSLKDKKSKPITGAHYMKLYKDFIPYCTTIYRIEFSIMRGAMNKIRDAYLDSGERFETDKYFIRDANRNGKNQRIHFFYNSKNITPFIKYLNPYIKAELTDSNDFKINEDRVNDKLRECLDLFLNDTNFNCVRLEGSNLEDQRLLKSATGLVRSYSARQYVMKEGLGSKLTDDKIYSLIDHAADVIKENIHKESFLKDFKKGVLNLEVETVIKNLIKSVFEKSEADQIDQKIMNDHMRYAMHDVLLTLASDQMMDDLKKVSRTELGK